LIKDKNKASILATVLILIVVVFNLPFFHPEKILRINDSEKLFSEIGWLKLQTDAIFDYLPKAAEKPPAESAPEEPWFEEGGGDIKDYQERTDEQEFLAQVGFEKATIRLPIYYFPNWKVWVDEKIAPIDYENELGLITFEVPKGEHRVKAKLTNTPIRTLGNLISLVSWAGLIGFVIKRKD
jgi:hypothetical protein